MEEIYLAMNFLQAVKNIAFRASTCAKFLVCRLFHLPALFPRYIRIETTSLCNLRCKICPHSNTSADIPRGFMAPELFKRIVGQIAAYPQNRSSLFYLHICGEPLLHRDIVELINYASAKGMKPVLTTNATLLSEEVSDKLLLSGLHKIEFSFEGIDRDIYEATRSGANYANVLKNIMVFLEKNKALGKPVLTELVVVDLPYVDARLIQDFCQKMQPLFDTINLAAYFDWLGKVTPAKFKKSRYFGCNSLSNSLNVLWNGLVVPCCIDVDGEMAIGDFNQMDYIEVLTAKKRRDLAFRLRTGNLSGLLCQKCANPWQGRKLRDSLVLN